MTRRKASPPRSVLAGVGIPPSVESPFLGVSVRASVQTQVRRYFCGSRLCDLSTRVHRRCVEVDLFPSTIGIHRGARAEGGLIASTGAS